MLRQPEVEQLGRPRPRQHDVFRLDIAVQDARGVRVAQRFEHTAGPCQRLGQPQRAHDAAAAQGLSGNPFHGDECVAVDSPDS